MKIEESSLMSSVSNVIDFIKSQTKQDLIEAKNREMIKLDVNELEKISRIIETSIQNGFVKSSSEITRLFKK